MKRLFQGLRPNVVWLGLASFFTDFASEMVFPLMPQFLKVVLGAGKATLGLIEGAADSLAALLRIVSGWASDRVGKRKPFIFWGYVLSSAMRPVYAVVTAPWQVFAIRMADRLGKGTRLAARDALIADSCEPGARGRAYGLQNAMDQLGAAVGPLVAGLMLAQGMTFQQVFLWTSIPAAAVIAIIAVLVRDLPATPRETPLRLTLKPFSRNFRWFLATIAVFTLANSSDAFLVQRMPEIGIPLAWTTVAWAGFNVLKALTALPGGFIADHHERRSVMLAGWIVYVAVYAGFAFADTPAPFLACLAAYTLFNALAVSVQRAVVADLVPAELKGTAFGLFYFAIGLAALPSSLLFGFLAERFTPRVAFLTDAGIALVACGMLLRVRRPARG
ncbi:MAG: MFS transporter [Planctomycetia bacterium]|nr:MFS transporter [Planctomycetia bacterium]